MTKSDKAGLIILGAVVAVASYRFFTMPKEERKEFIRHISATTNDLLDNAEDTMDKVNNFITQIDNKGKDEWIDKLYLVKKLFREFYGSEKRYLL